MKLTKQNIIDIIVNRIIEFVDEEENEIAFETICERVGEFNPEILKVVMDELRKRKIKIGR